MFILHLIFALDAALLIGLSHPRDYSDLARVNDTNGINYIITAVDGEKPLHDSAPYEDVVPIVLVKAGHHKFTLQQRDDDAKHREIETDVKAGVEYRILETQAGALTLVPTTP
jgi:hypothetical protein